MTTSLFGTFFNEMAFMLLKELVTCEFEGLAVSNYKFETFGLMVWLKELKPR